MTVADVAQLVEHGFRKAEVVGSNPTVGSTNEKEDGLRRPPFLLDRTAGVTFRR